MYRVVVNAPCSQGAAGFATNLPPSFTIGTGFSGRSSIGENMGPQHLVHWTRIAYAKDQSADLSTLDFKSISAIEAEPNIAHHSTVKESNKQTALDHDELRKLILEELRNLKGEI